MLLYCFDRNYLAGKPEAGENVCDQEWESHWEVANAQETKEGTVMRARRTCLRCSLPIVILSLGVLWDTDVAAEGVLRVYGPKGPFPAMEEAAGAAVC